MHFAARGANPNLTKTQASTYRQPNAKIAHRTLLYVNGDLNLLPILLCLWI